jgi:hypothetical protein
MNNDTCPICQGTGMTRSGYLDCMHAGCNAASDRAAFNHQLEELGILPRDSIHQDIVWQVHQMTRSGQLGGGHAG